MRGDDASSLAEQLLKKGSLRGVALPNDDVLQRRCPLLWSLVVQDAYKDGTERVLPTIVISRVSGGFLVTLQDHASNQQVQAVTLTLANAWVDLEKVLSKGGDAFRPYKSFKVKDPSKRKKLS